MMAAVVSAASQQHVCVCMYVCVYVCVCVRVCVCVCACAIKKSSRKADDGGYGVCSLPAAAHGQPYVLCDLPRCVGLTWGKY